MTRAGRTLAALGAGFRAPVLPENLRGLVAALSDPEAGLVKLERIIVRDPGLVMRILRTVNAATFGLPNRIGDIRQAIILLGVPAVSTLAAGYLVTGTIGGSPGLATAQVRRCWRRAVRDAAGVRLLARDLPPADGQAVLLAAMCQHVGHLMLARHFGDRYTDLGEGKPLPTPDLETALVGIDHAVAGSALLSGWEFPAPVVAMVELHHTDVRGPGAGDGVRRLQAATALLDGLDRDPGLLGRPAIAVDERLRDALSSIGWTWERVAGERRNWQAAALGPAE
ncbi:MAG: HDOD domain-containing protein [Candidatus Krumholzibacteriia bacterium]